MRFNADKSSLRQNSFKRPVVICAGALTLAAGICLTTLFFARGFHFPRGETASQESGHVTAGMTRTLGPVDRTFPNRETPPEDRMAQEALALADRHLKRSESQSAYDALLSAMRISPGDERVFQASLEFIRNAGVRGNDDSRALADDMLQRAANLIPFLPLPSLEKARREHTAAGNALFPTNGPAPPDNPLAEAEKLLEAVDLSLPTSVNTRLLQEVEAELANQSTRFALVQRGGNRPVQFWKHWKAVKERHDKAENMLLTNLYHEDCQKRLQAWLEKVQDANKQLASTDLTAIHQANGQILDLISEGQRISRDLLPYVEAGVQAAVHDNQQSGLDKRLVGLSQLREWNYNRWALDRIEQVEQSGGDNLEKLKSLSNIDEARLAPYMAQQLAEVWKKFFDECSKDDKVEATKLRILREYQK